jgi:hypothetical protein
MNKIWGFGDSFTFGHGCRPDGPNVAYYYGHKKENDKIWLDWLGEYMNMRAINLGICGASNDTILDSIIDNWENIKNDDIVIIGITYNGRFDIPINNRLQSVLWDWEERLPIIDKDKNFRKEEIETVLNFKYYFSNSELYKNRQLKRISFIERLLKSKNIKCFTWDVKSYVIFDSIDTIKNDTNGLIDDSHFSFKGHYDFANIIHKKITNNMSLI